MRASKVIEGDERVRVSPPSVQRADAAHASALGALWSRTWRLAGTAWTRLFDRNGDAAAPSAMRRAIPIAARSSEGRDGLLAYAALLDEQRGLFETNRRIKSITRLWSFADDTYRVAARRPLRSEPDRTIGRRELLSVKIGRVSGRAVSRIRLETPFAGERSLIEKVYVSSKRNSESVSDYAELRFYLTYPRSTSPLFDIPRLLSLAHTPEGVVLLLEDMTASPKRRFRQTRLDLSVESLGPLVGALAAFNYAQQGHDAERAMGVASASDLYVVVWGEHQVRWGSLAKTTNAPAELVRQLTTGIARFSREKDEILGALGRQGLVLSHNDVARGNILSGTDGRLVFIDFESVRMTPPGFDIGNLLVFAVRGHASAGSLPETPDLVALHRELADAYVAACPPGARPERDLVLRASAFAFAARMLATPKRLRVLLRQSGSGARSRTIVIEFFSQMLALALDGPRR